MPNPFNSSNVKVNNLEITASTNPLLLVLPVPSKQKKLNDQLETILNTVHMLWVFRLLACIVMTWYCPMFYTNIMLINSVITVNMLIKLILRVMILSSLHSLSEVMGFSLYIRILSENTALKYYIGGSSLNGETCWLWTLNWPPLGHEWARALGRACKCAWHSLSTSRVGRPWGRLYVALRGNPGLQYTPFARSSAHTW